MGAAAVPAAIFASSVVSSAMQRGGSSSTETKYRSQPFEYTLPSGAKITLYHYQPIGESTSKSGNGLINALGQGIGAAGQSYALGSTLNSGQDGAVTSPDGNYVEADAGTSFTNYVDDPALAKANYPDYVTDWYKG